MAKKSKFLVNYNQLVPKVIYVHLQLALCYIYIRLFGLPRLVLVEKDPPDNAGDIKDVGLIVQWTRSPGGRHGNPLLYSCLENSMDREASWVIVHGISRSHEETEMT